MYDVNNYGGMMLDAVRMSAFTRTLRRVVKPGCVVVDVGTGLGVFALLAAKLGARKVYAIDTNPCINLAREVAKKNGLDDRIEFFEKSVFDVELPEKADVLISDCRGHFPLYDSNIEIVASARTRFLKPGGIVVSEKDDIYVALSQQPKIRRDLEAPWMIGGLDWEPCRKQAVSTPIIAGSPDIDPATLLTGPLLWTTIDYRTVTSPSFHGTVEGKVASDGNAQFLCLWFRATASPGIEFGVGFDGSDVYRPLLLPLDPPLDVHAGEAVRIRIDALRSKSAYCFSWSVETPSGRRQQSGDGLEMATFFRQNERKHEA